MNASSAQLFVMHHFRPPRKILPLPGCGWVVLAVTWPSVELALDQGLVDEWTTLAILQGCLLFAIVLLLCDPIRRLAGVLWAFLFAYFTGAFVARYGFGLSYFPFVSDDVFDQVALTSMRAFALSFISFYPLLRDKWCRTSLAALQGALDQIAAISRQRMFGICALIVMIGIVDWAVLLTVGIGAVTESGRRAFADDLLLAGDHNTQAIAIPITIVALLHAWQKRDRSLRALVCLCVSFAWLPSLLAGARKEIFIICIAFSLPELLKRSVSLRTRLLIVCAAIVFVSIPILFDGEVDRGFHEFILPFYIVISVHEYADYLAPTAPFLSGIQLLVPSILRPADTHVFGSDVYYLMTFVGQTVGYGGQPYAEALAFAKDAPAFMFLMSNAILVGTCVMLARTNRIYTLIAFPYLALWGRSILWVNLFFIFYGGLVSILLVSFKSGGVSITNGRCRRLTPTERATVTRSRVCLGPL